jgi:ABC-type polysaccharide/polyol phosphate transport system ATPase subunit
MSPSASGTPAVLVNDLSKGFNIPRERRHTLKERVLHPLGGRGHERLNALKGVSFEVERGEFFGVVGRNGSGKSTLLKCLAGIYRTDQGEIYLDGRVSPFIELGVGFNPELAARDNVVLNGIMLGLSPGEARDRFERVIEFAELEEFVDLKLKNYSSGMHVRLAFSVMIQVDADVLLVDEILAVGDASFQQKCFDVFFRMREAGKTIVFVTHDMAAVERFCHRALLLERGHIVDIGDPKAVAERYLELNFESATAEATKVSGRRGGRGGAQILKGAMEDGQGRAQSVLHQGQHCAFAAEVRFDQPVDDPVFSVTFVNADRQNVFVATTSSSGLSTGHFDVGERASFRLEFENSLAPGRYWVSTIVARPGPGNAQHMHRWEQMLSFVVGGAQAAGGLVDLPHEFRLERSVVDSQAEMA